jgi:hypothetical protein
MEGAGYYAALFVFTGNIKERIRELSGNRKKKPASSARKVILRKSLALGDIIMFW